MERPLNHSQWNKIVKWSEKLSYDLNPSPENWDHCDEDFELNLKIDVIKF